MTDMTILPGHFETGIAGRTRGRIGAGQISRRNFFGVLALIFIASATVTVLRCNSMAAMGSMSMQGGWTMSMAWMRMPGETWAGAAASFVAMWVVMMVAMMLPSLTPSLWRSYQSVKETCNASRNRFVMLVGAGYFFVWTLFGLALFPLGAAIAAVQMEWPALAHAAPVAVGWIVLAAGTFQFTSWKARHLDCCRESGNECSGRVRTGAGWIQGLRLGFHCGLSCANLTAILLVAGVMDLRAMAAITVAITAERLAPAGHGVSRAIGVVAVGAGMMLIAGVVRHG